MQIKNFFKPFCLTNRNESMQFYMVKVALLTSIISGFVFLFIDMMFFDIFPDIVFNLALGLTLIFLLLTFAHCKNLYSNNFISRIASLFILFMLCAIWFIAGGYHHTVVLLFLALLIFRLVTSDINPVLALITILAVKFGLFAINQIFPNIIVIPLNDFQVKAWFVLNTIIGFSVCTYFIFELKMQYKIQVKRAEVANTELKKINYLKDGLFAIIAHDLKGPMNNMQAVISMLKEDIEENSQNSQLIDILAKRVDNTAEVLNNLLLWSKSQLHGLEINNTEIQLSDFFTQLKLFQQSFADRKSINIITSCEPDIKLNTDVDILHTLLRNLLANAIKFSHQNSQIELNAMRINESSVKIEVKDSGVGMSEETLKNLFIPKHTKSYGTSKEEGVGLGMLIVDEYAQHIGAKLTVESTPGTGTSIGLIFNNLTY